MFRVMTISTDQRIAQTEECLEQIRNERSLGTATDSYAMTRMIALMLDTIVAIRETRRDMRQLPDVDPGDQAFMEGAAAAAEAMDEGRRMVFRDPTSRSLIQNAHEMDSLRATVGELQTERALLQAEIDCERGKRTVILGDYSRVISALEPLLPNGTKFDADSLVAAIGDVVRDRAEQQASLQGVFQQIAGLIR